jgi:glycosyltransferase involved in cell wall biosynthesis
MACGVPAIVRDLASLRETGGSGTTYVDGDDAASWASAIQALLDDDPRYATARASAIAAARRFSWADFADRVAEALKPRR